MLKCLSHIDQVFRAFGDPTRLRIVEHLSIEPASVSQLAAPLGITLAAIMQHLAILEHSGLVSTRKDGRTRTVELNPEGFAVASTWINERRALWERRLDRLAVILDENDAKGETTKLLPPKPSLGNRAARKEK